ncbi:MAG: hypothetical protein C0621_06900 [Desulfuromonas sp.]|nr:MAG: hypothetical protein C0621_06900 [Desulfuromonas sp.]
MRCERWVALLGLMLWIGVPVAGAESLGDNAAEAVAPLVEEGDVSSPALLEPSDSALPLGGSLEESSRDAVKDTPEEPVSGEESEAAVDSLVIEEAAPVVPAPAAPVVDPKEEERRRVKETSFAFLKHECLPLTTVEEGGFFSFLSNDTSPLVATCIADLDYFVRRNWHDPMAGEALMLQAKLFRVEELAAAEAVALGKIVYLLEDAPLRSQAAKRLQEMGGERLKREQENLAVLAGGGRGDEEASRYARLLTDLASFEDRDFVDLMRKECDDFLWRYSGTAEAELVWELREALALREHHYESAAFGLRKMVTLYPESRLRPARLLKLGGVYENELKVEQEAVATYEMVFTSYSEAPEALPAYQRAAALYNGKLEEYEKGIKLLDKIVELYPTSDAARQALQDQSEVFAGKLRNYFAAIKADQRLADMFRGDAAVTALLDAATLARKHLEDLDLQIELLERLVREYPQREEAPQALYDIAEIYEDDLAQVTKAIETYGRVEKNYGEHRLAEKARARIEKLSRP